MLFRFWVQILAVLNFPFKNKHLTIFWRHFIYYTCHKWCHHFPPAPKEPKKETKQKVKPEPKKSGEAQLENTRYPSCQQNPQKYTDSDSENFIYPYGAIERKKTKRQCSTATIMLCFYHHIFKAFSTNKKYFAWCFLTQKSPKRNPRQLLLRKVKHPHKHSWVVSSGFSSSVCNINKKKPFYWQELLLRRKRSNQSSWKKVRLLYTQKNDVIF